MAICFVRAKVINRGGGGSAVAAAAYRSGEKLFDEATGQTHDYTKKHGIDYSEILSPMLATAGNEWLLDRSALWNKVEASEKRCDAQLSREIIIAIPRELDQADQIALVRKYVQSSYVDRGMIADINLHHLDGDNPHAHVMLTMRELKVDEQGIVSFGNKNRTWNDRKQLATQVKEWEVVANQYLENAGFEEKIDSRSYEEQGIARVPQIHVGMAAWRLEQQGIQTVPGDYNREVAELNRLIEVEKNIIVAAQINIELELKLDIKRRAEEADRQARAARWEAEEADRQARAEEMWRGLDKLYPPTPRELEARRLAAESPEQKVDRIKAQAEKEEAERILIKAQSEKEAADRISIKLQAEKEAADKQRLDRARYGSPLGEFISKLQKLLDAQPSGSISVSKTVEALKGIAANDPINKNGIEKLIFRLQDIASYKRTDQKKLADLLPELKNILDNPTIVVNKRPIETQDDDQTNQRNQGRGRGR